MLTNSLVLLILEGHAWTLSITLRTLVISKHGLAAGSFVLISSGPPNQCIGGLGSTLGDGGSLNLAPAYALDCSLLGETAVGGGDLEAVNVRVLDGVILAFRTPYVEPVPVTCSVGVCQCFLLVLGLTEWLPPLFSPLLVWLSCLICLCWAETLSWFLLCMGLFCPTVESMLLLFCWSAWENRAFLPCKDKGWYGNFTILFTLWLQAVF